MKLIILVAVVMLTGCGANGEPLLLAAWYDRQDPCQYANNGGKYPSFCGASGGGGSTVRTYYGNRPVYTVR